MKKFGILLSLLVTATLSTWAQGAKSIRITELMPNNQASIVDEYGATKHGWNCRTPRLRLIISVACSLPPTDVCSTRTCRPRNGES